MTTKYSICMFCDSACPVRIDDNGGVVTLSPTDPNGPALCSKATHLLEYRDHPDRIVRPLKNIGTRGEPEWEEISWDQALDEIAERLQAVIDEYGPLSVAVSEMLMNHGGGGLVRRLMNCIGTPNYITGMELCGGNTSQVHRAIYGWYSLSDWSQTDCIVCFGQNRGPESWPLEAAKRDTAIKNGAKLIFIDPRDSDIAQRADYHLRVRYGTDTALMLAWINTIITEELYDKEFVASSCLGFAELASHVESFTPEWAQEVCGIDAATIRETARVYANSKAAIIPWGVVGDMQSNSTSMLHCQCILRAICGFLNKTETLYGPGFGIVTNAELAAFDKLTDEACAAQLGANEHPLLTLKTRELYKSANERFGITYTCDIQSGSACAVPPHVFAAMRGEGPYPVKAFFSIASNPMMGYAGQQGIVKALMNQDLVVVYDHWMTPTAQLADYVLPGDAWFERDVLDAVYDIVPLFNTTQAAYAPVGECKGIYFLIKGLADRLGFGGEFPWEDAHELYDYRLSRVGVTFEEACAQAPAPVMGTMPALGQFVTPSSKVELKSSVLETLGFDPLPSYKEPADPGAEGGDYPYVLFAGYRDRPFYNTNFHQMKHLSARQPYPELFINPADAAAEGLEGGEWCKVSSAYGSVQLKAKVDEAQPAGTLRVPHGWWEPAAPKGLSGDLAKANLYNDAMLFPDASWNLDPAQGLPNLRGGIHGRIEKL